MTLFILIGFPSVRLPFWYPILNTKYFPEYPTDVFISILVILTWLNILLKYDITFELELLLF